MPRHAATLPDTRAALHILDLLGSLAALLALLLGVQITWQYWGSGLDVTYRNETVSRTLGFSEPASNADGSEMIAPAETSDPPVVSAGAYREGDVMGWMYIPALDKNWKRAIQEGVGDDVLNNLGVGHYPNTAMPGARGNTAYAGHRTPSDLGYADRLRAGDAIIIRTENAWIVYKVSRLWVVPGTDGSVLAQTSDRELTLTTCDPMLTVGHARNRLIIRAEYDHWADPAKGVPAELADDTGSTGTAGTIVRRVERDVNRVARSTPVTPVLAMTSTLMWVIMAGLAALLCRGKPFKGSWNLLTLVWRCQRGPLVVRVVELALFAMAVVFAMWAWVCPWLADTVPWLATPHPTVA